MTRIVDSDDASFAVTRNDDLAHAARQQLERDPTIDVEPESPVQNLFARSTVPDDDDGRVYGAERLETAPHSFTHLTPALRTVVGYPIDVRLGDRSLDAAGGSQGQADCRSIVQLT